MKFALIHEHRRELPVRFLCRALKVSSSGYYKWASHQPSTREVEDRRLRVEIRVIFKASRGTYGSPRIAQELRALGYPVSRHRVARLMRAEKLVGRPQKRFRTTTLSGPGPWSPNLVPRRTRAQRPNEIWVSDITYIRTWTGWLYLAVVIDLYSRRVVGFAIADHMRADLVVAALRLAAATRRPPRGLIVHSDRGSQYGSHRYRRELAKLGARQSMSATGSCFDNAVAESFFSTLKQELVYRYSWHTEAQASQAITEYLTSFYNPARRHSALGYLSPVEFELNYRAEMAA